MKLQRWVVKGIDELIRERIPEALRPHSEINKYECRNGCGTFECAAADFMPVFFRASGDRRKLREQSLRLQVKPVPQRGQLIGEADTLWNARRERDHNAELGR